MDQRLNDYLNKHMDELLYLLSIPSVYDETTARPGRPCGDGVGGSLDYMRALALKDGFLVEDFDGHAIAIYRPEDAAKTHRIDVVSHLDVVEPGEGWTMDPFKPCIKQDAIYGRGSEDMKTPAFLTYLAFKLLAKEGISSERQLRIVLGTDEERTMDDMIYYLEKAGKPDFAFSPDGSFPMAIGEKGALMWRITGTYEGELEELDAGVQCNVISPKAYARLKNGNEVRTEGKAAHASDPSQGESATLALLKQLRHQDDLLESLFTVFEDSYGKSLGYDLPRDMGHSVTLNLGILKIRDGRIYGEVDCRYPAGVTSFELTKRLQEKIPGAEISLDYDSPPTMNDPEDPCVKTLLDVFYEKTGRTDPPYVSGGVTYGKVFGHCVAYGPTPMQKESLAHQADEHLPLKVAQDAFEIYFEAMKRLMEMPLTETENEQ